MYSTFSSTLSFGKMKVANIAIPTGLITSNLVLHLDVSNTSSYNYETGGNTWFDLTDNNLDATLVNYPGMTWYTSQNTDAHFAFGDNGYVSIPHDSRLSLSTTQVKTFQIWIRFDVQQFRNLPILGVNDSTIVNKISSSYNFDGYTLRVNANGSMRMVTNGGSIAKSTVGHFGKFVANTWYFVTVHSAINNTANSTRVFVNSNTTPYIDTAHGTDSYNESNALTLALPGASTGGANLAYGRIAAFYFYDKQLSTSEIAQNFNATKSKFGIS